MNLLGLDTSLATTSVCLLRDDGTFVCTPPPEPARLLGPAAHSQELLPELERIIGESGRSWDEIDSIAIGIGPGTFTGLRIGVATARALGQARGIGLRPVSSLEALAAAAADASSESGDLLLSLIDARRREVFAALYSHERPNRAAPGEQRSFLVELWKPAVIEPDALIERIGGLDEAPLCIGDWAIKSRAELEGAGTKVPPSESGFHAVSALSVCKLAIDIEPVAPEEIYPVYLRLPDAEINRRLARGQLYDTDDK